MVALEREPWFNRGMMTKTEAIERLGGTVSAAAKAIGITYQAVNKWPDLLSQRIADRVIAAEVRARRNVRGQPSRSRIAAEESEHA